MKRVLCIITILLIGLNGNIKAQGKKFNKIQQYADKSIEDGLTGVSIYIKHPKFGVRKITAGLANMETGEKMKSSNAMYLASISKTYCALAVVIANEEGILKFDDKIDQYLPPEIIDNLPSGNELTIRHLINMSSGLFNYEWDTTLNELYLGGKMKLDTISHYEMIERYVFDKEQRFSPGTKYNYSSTNYLLLMKILDEALGYPHQDFISKKIIQKNGLNQTYYKNEYERIENLVSSYGDLDEDGVLENISDKQWETTSWFIGDDGLIATAENIGILLEKLLQGEILNEASFNEMTNWITLENPVYGMGLSYDKAFPYGEIIGHSGVAIGATSDAYYFPKQKITVVVMSNTGKRGGDEKFRKAYNKLLQRMIIKLFLI